MVRYLRSRRIFSLALFLLAVAALLGTAAVSHAQGAAPPSLAPTPPMGWSDWTHYQCGYTAQTILANARALVRTGLAARGYNTVSFDECWMLRSRDPLGNLEPDPQRFPHGVKPVADAIHALGLRFGIYADAGWATCAGYAGSGQPNGGGQDYFLRDAKLFASWGVDYLKLDGCNLYVPPGETKEQAYHKAYAAAAAALRQAGRPMVFSESAPGSASFQGTPEWYDVIAWCRLYGQLWREGTDMANYDAKDPDRPRFHSVLWNYSYNLPLGRFQKPANWNDPDFIIAGDSGVTTAESRSQMALWSMMSAPLILSVDVARLSPEAIAIVGNQNVIAVDQDPLGRMASLLRRTPEMDVLFKRLSAGNDAVAVFNRSDAPLHVTLHPADLGFSAASVCRLDAHNLWTATSQPAATTLQAEVGPHDTALWRIHPSAPCGTPARLGAIVMINADPHYRKAEGYTRCLAASAGAESGIVAPCTGAPAESWTITPAGSLRSSTGRCLAITQGKPQPESCRPVASQHWRYTLVGNLISAANDACLTAEGPQNAPQSLALAPCGHNLPTQIWSLPTDARATPRCRLSTGGTLRHRHCADRF